MIDNIDLFLRKNYICKEEEDYTDVLQRVCKALATIETNYFSTSCSEFSKIIEKFKFYFGTNIVTLGSPILTSIGKDNNHSVASCAAYPLNCYDNIKNSICDIEKYYLSNIGLGLNFDSLSDPISILKLLNEHAEKFYESHHGIRYIGNMAMLSYKHAKIFDFAKFKCHNEISHFNLSVTLDDEFCGLFLNNATNVLPLNTNKKLTAQEFLLYLSECIYCSAEPGVVFLDRIKRNNTVPSLGEYYTVAPCAEIGMAYGDLCLFGYINVAKLLTVTKTLDYDLLKNVTINLTRILDDCVQIQAESVLINNKLVKQKRRIAIGICGFSELLLKMKIIYGSLESIDILKNILLNINFYSKLESVNLAKKRGCFLAYNDSLLKKGTYLVNKFAGIDNGFFSTKDWQLIDKLIVTGSGIRNASTTAIPPSGRSSIMLNTTPSIEPFLSVYEEDEMGLKFSHFKVNSDIGYMEQLNILDTATKCVDDGVSKTINLNKNCSVEDIYEILCESIRLSINGITVYRDQTMPSQPVAH